MTYIWKEVGDVTGFPAKYYECTVCKMPTTAIWTLGGYKVLELREVHDFTCEKYIIKNIIE